MQRLLPKILSLSRRCSVMKVSKPLTANEGQKCLNLTASDIICKLNWNKLMQSRCLRSFVHRSFQKYTSESPCLIGEQNLNNSRRFSRVHDPNSSSSHARAVNSSGRDSSVGSRGCWSLDDDLRGVPFGNRATSHRREGTVAIRGDPWTSCAEDLGEVLEIRAAPRYATVFQSANQQIHPGYDLLKYR